MSCAKSSLCARWSSNQRRKMAPRSLASIPLQAGKAAFAASIAARVSVWPRSGTRPTTAPVAGLMTSSAGAPVHVPPIRHWSLTIAGVLGCMARSLRRRLPGCKSRRLPGRMSCLASYRVTCERGVMLSGATIVFDLDGTLVDTAPDLTNALNHVLRQRGHAPAAPALVRESAGRGARAMIEEALSAAGGLAHERRCCGRVAALPQHMV